MEDAEDYKAFEAAITADYDAQSAVERELVLRLASVLWRLRRAMTIETGLFENQSQDLGAYRQNGHLLPDSHVIKIKPEARTVEFARCFLRLANLPNFALDRLSRYEASLWRQAGRILYALETVDRRKPQERTPRFWFEREKQFERE
jgi:hypothetical protein